MPVPEQSQIYDKYIASGLGATFPYSFLCLKAIDITVFANRIVVDPAAYTVTGVGQEAGGAVVFNATPAAGVEILIWLDVTLERVTNYQLNGDLRSAVVNPDFDRLWLAMQGAFAGLDRAIQAPIDESLGLLPSAADRLGKAAIFDSVTGEITVSDVAFNDQIDIVSGLAGDAAAQAALAAQLAANADGSATDAAGSAGAALDAASQLQSYIDDAVTSGLTFPYDMGLIADPVVSNNFDLGTI